jgi:hypothetical protein
MDSINTLSSSLTTALSLNQYHFLPATMHFYAFPGITFGASFYYKNYNWFSVHLHVQY